jgi:hypothetical protein
MGKNGEGFGFDGSAAAVGLAKEDGGVRLSEFTLENDFRDKLACN